MRYSMSGPRLVIKKPFSSFSLSLLLSGCQESIFATALFAIPRLSGNLYTALSSVTNGLTFLVLLRKRERLFSIETSSRVEYINEK